MALKNIKRGEAKSGSATKPASEDNLPVITSASDGAIMVSAGKHARNAVLTAFEMIGGTQRLVEEADADPKWFYEKLFAKTITREVEQHKADDLEGLLEAIDAEAEEVPDAVDVESESV